MQIKNKTIAVGDLHGHYNELMFIMKCLQESKYNINFKRDIFVFVGDFVDGGPDTKKVTDQLIKWKKKYPHWKFLYGNHEDLLLDALNPKHPIYGDYYLWWNQGGKETTESYIKDSKYSDYERALVNPVNVIPAEHIEFMYNLDTWYEDDKYFYVHGGVHAFHTIEWCKKNWKRYDFIWERDFIKSNFQWEKKIIFGHTIQWTKNPKTHLQPWVYPNKIGIDTFAHNMGRLTAVVLPDEKFVQTDFTWDAIERKVS